MLKTISLPVGSLLFMLVLLVVYLHKSRVAKYKNKYFLGLLILLIGVLVTEIGTYFSMLNMIKHPKINEAVARVHSIMDLAWTITMAGYLFSYVKNNSKNKKEKNPNRVFIFLFIITSVISFFMPFDFVVKGDSAYLSGLALGFLYTIGVGVVVIAGVLVLINQKDILFIKKLPIIVAIIETSITVPLSLAYPTMYIITTSFAFKTYLIYFTLENPDLYLISELKKQKKNADDSSRAKSDFLSNMSNEIRTPMNAIIGFSEAIIKDSNLDLEEAKNDIKHIYSAGGTLLEIINNILDISKIESGEEIVETKEYNLASIILELHSIIDARLAGSKVRFVTNIDESLPAKIEGDKTKIFQILLNILSNSVKYTEVGRIELKIKGEIVKDDVILHIRVSDTGLGIKEEDYNKIFEKLVSSENTPSINESEGAGLGLVISKKLVTLLNGKIWFESKYGAGTDFYLDIPQRIVDRSFMGDIFTSEANAKNMSDKYFDCSNYKVLLVDDNELNLKVAKKLLSPYNFQITVLNNGQDCVNLIKSGEEYDLIFLDHMMPGMDGIEVLHILKSLESYDIPPVVALTANAITGMREMYIKEGFDDYLAKPINIGELNRLLEKYFKNK